MPKEFVPGSRGAPDQPPAADEARTAEGGAPATGMEGGPRQGQGTQPEPAEGGTGAGSSGGGGDVGTGARDPAGTSARNDVDMPVRPGGGGATYASGEGELPDRHARDVLARGAFEPGGASGADAAPARGGGPTGEIGPAGDRSGVDEERGAYRATVSERGDDVED